MRDSLGCYLSANGQAVVRGMWIVGASVLSIGQRVGVDRSTIVGYLRWWSLNLTAPEWETHTDGEALVTFEGPVVVGWDSGEWGRAEAFKMRVKGWLS